jgi:hypothetical protein
MVVEENTTKITASKHQKIEQKEEIEKIAEMQEESVADVEQETTNAAE